MNGTVVQPATIRKLKKLSSEIETLKSFTSMFGILTPRQELKLNLKTEKLIKIIKGL